MKKFRIFSQNVAQNTPNVSGFLDQLCPERTQRTLDYLNNLLPEIDCIVLNEVQRFEYIRDESGRRIAESKGVLNFRLKKATNP